METDNGLARARRPADSCRSREAATHELRLVGMEERHPLLDRRREKRVEQLGLDFFDTRELGDVELGRRIGYRFRDRDGQWRGGAHVREELEYRFQDGLNHGGRQSLPSAGEVASDV